MATPVIGGAVQWAGAGVHWDSSGRPYSLIPSTGKKKYIAPDSALYSLDPRLRAWAQQMGASTDTSGPVERVDTGAPKGGLVRTGGQWNYDTGEWEQGLNWGALIPLGVATGVLGGAGIAALPGVGGAATTGITGAKAAALPGALSTVPALGTGSTLAGIGRSLLNPSTLSTLGRGISDATSAAGNTQRANADTTAGNQALYEQEMLNLARQEQTERRGAASDIYRQSRTENPRVSPFNTVGPSVQSPEYLALLKRLSTRGSETLAQPAQYSTKTIPKPVFEPTRPSTLQNVGNWAGPALSTAALIANVIRGGR